MTLEKGFNFSENFIILRRKRKYSAFTATIKGTNEYFR